MRKQGVEAVIAIMVVAGLSVGYLSAIGTRAAETITSVSTSTVTLTVTSTSTETPVFTHGVLVAMASASALNLLTGLSLDLNLSVNANGQVVVTTYEFNTLDRINNVSYGSTFLNTSFFQWTRTSCYGGGMEGYEILQGNYGSNNFTSGKAVWLQPQIFVGSCSGLETSTETSNSTSYSFKPLGAESVLSGAYVGFWTNPSDDSTYQPFAPGTYTVIAADEWGQVAISYFIVVG